MHEPDRITRAWLILLRARRLPPGVLRRALGETGDVTVLTGSSVATLRALGFGELAAHDVQHPSQQIESDLAWTRSAGARLVPIDSPAYPAQLAAVTDAPPVLVTIGDVALLAQPQMAIVGSRDPTAAGRRVASSIAGELATAGLVITSGLARGIDTAAHQAALAQGAPTIAVCGTGLGVCYPPENRALFERIAREGLLVSEFAPDAPARATHFPRRNRIISGLARGVVVVEAAAASGSLITARLALEQGREVFAVPGSPLNPQAAGCLTLIRQGAQLVRSAGDILPDIRIPLEIKTESNQTPEDTLRACRPAGWLDKDYEMLLDALGFEPASIDDLVEKTGLGPAAIASMMLILELEGSIESRPGALYNRIK